MSVPKIPNIANLHIASAKFAGYLLSSTRRDGAPKAAFFESFGFTPARPAELSDAVRAHAHNHDIARIETTSHGTIDEVHGPLETPSGRNLFVLVVWIVRHGETFPRLVTAVPSEPNVP